ncbi:MULTISPECIES: hypothetical protein [Serratia]|uniref:Uncharacterized protein n=1 Tax=Serratia marcescens TaxID=615 RepID=A0ABD5BE10_SERMA|nr:hypothetical protein [Serratia marcescens]ELH4238912.1 hypothetical protein [Serratia marcescens]ELM0003397.1 hypothetical protein [Serratia marcescens]MBH3240637.1 hypothetical protein [Serratia marcescens]MBN5410145.1 hypothetical protein [Serratia marcescens]MDP8025469.1 hypothetical protein [Serratia marcescens]
MVEKTLDKEIELREWQKMFNPSKAEARPSVILREKPQDKEKNSNNHPVSQFSW